MTLTCRRCRQRAYAPVVEIDERFYPYRTTPKRIALDAAEALASVAGVVRVALVGPIAADRHDGHSLIDLLAATEEVDASVAAVAALHEALPVRFYHPSPDSPAPSGAYWLTGESPFHRVEVEFSSPGAYDIAIRAARAAEWELGTAVPGPLVREFRASDRQLLAAGDGIPDVLRTPSSAERDVGATLVLAIDRMAEYLRGRSDIDPAIHAMQALEQTYAAAGHPASTPAGHLGGLVMECRELWQTLYLAHLRAESGIEVLDGDGVSG